MAFLQLMDTVVQFSLLILILLPILFSLDNSSWDFYSTNLSTLSRIPFYNQLFYS